MRKKTNRSIALAFGMVSIIGCGGAGIAATPMVSLGQDHALALRSDGTVVAWGSDEYGQLGIGRASYSASPLVVAGISSVQAVGAGREHFLTVKQDGTVWAWGWNYGGQLGDGTAISRTTPVQVKNFGNAIAVAGGDAHSIALKQDGTVWSWGLNQSGMLGDGTQISSTVPVQVVGLSDVSSIACGSVHSISLRKDGTVWTWGVNFAGQLGDGTTTDRTRPVQVPGLSDVIAIGAGWRSSFALRRDGTVWEWGEASATGATRLSPVQTPGLTGVLALSAGVIYAIATRTDGTAWHWVTGATPTLLANADGLRNASFGHIHTLLLKTDRSLSAFGGNQHGEIGDGTSIYRTAPVAVISLSNIIAMASSNNTSVALGADGRVWAWGSDSRGQLGRGTTLIQSVPVQIPGLTDVVAVFASWEHSLALKQDGTVWSWGRNIGGQLGDGTGGIDRSVPAPVPGLVNVRAITAGVHHSVALKQDGTIWAWGNFNEITLNDDVSARFSSTPIQLPGLSGFTAIAASTHSLALKQDGTVWSWGSNHYGELGRGSATPYGSAPSSESVRPAQIPGLTNIAAIAAGARISFAVGADGRVWAWGEGASEANENGVRADSATPILISELSNVVAMSSGSFFCCGHALAYRSDGTVWGWGNNNSGQLGEGNPYVFTKATPLAGVTGVTQISAGGNFSAFLRPDGAVSMLGDNRLGQLGDGTFAQRRSPVLAVNTSANGFLNLYPGTDFEVPPSVGVPFFVASSGSITDTSASVSTTTKFNAADVDKSGAVYVTAAVPPGTLVATQSGLTGRGLSRADATAPSFVLIQLTASGWQPVVNGQLIPYASGVLGDQLAAQTILNGTDTTNLKGAAFCLGYGTSAEQMTAIGTMRVVATIPNPTATSASTASCIVGGPAVSYSLPVSPGWSLLGNSLNQTLPVASLYGDQNFVTTVWKWDAATLGWQFYTPAMDAATLQAYATSKGYTVLSEIKPGEGYWVNAKTQLSPTTQSGASYILTSTRVAKGWNLAATGLDISPSAFNSNLNASLSGTGVTTLWAWDNATSRWYFYAPSLEAQGGSALTSYITSKGYLDFTLGNKTLGKGTGFWVNR